MTGYQPASFTIRHADLAADMFLDSQVDDTLLILADGGSNCAFLAGFSGPSETSSVLRVAHASVNVNGALNVQNVATFGSDFVGQGFSNVSGVTYLSSIVGAMSQACTVPYACLTGVPPSTGGGSSGPSDWVPGTAFAAGATTVAALTADATTLASLSVPGATALFTLAAGATSLATLAVTGATALTGVLTAGVSTFTSIGAGPTNVSTLHAGTSILGTISAGATTVTTLTAGATTVAALTAAATTLSSLAVTGALSKGSGSFVIDHPDGCKSRKGFKLKHCFVESPTRGDNLYRYTVVTERLCATILLPGYFPFLNEDVQAWVGPVDVLGIGRCVLSSDNTEAVVHVSIDGTYSVLIIGTRKDDLARMHFEGEGGAEFIPHVGC